jgi:CHAD domain-containing protein
MNPLHAALRRRLRERWKSYRRELKACQREFSGESVHESRVAARRLLATLELLASLHETAALRRARRVLKRHLAILAPLRDAQVQSQFVAAWPDRWPVKDDFAKFLRQQTKRAARPAEKGVSRLKTRRLAKVVARLDHKLRRRQDGTSEPADFQRLLTNAARSFARARSAKAGLNAARPETIHRLRVAFKRFRYTVELLSPFLPELPADYLPALRSYQGEMGAIQDLTVLLATAAAFAEDEQHPPAKTRAMLREIQRHRERLIRRFLQHANRLDTFWPWK